MLFFYKHCDFDIELNDISFCVIDTPRDVPSSQADDGSGHVFRAVPVMVSPTVQLTSSFNSQQVWIVMQVL